MQIHPIFNNFHITFNNNQQNIPKYSSSRYYFSSNTDTFTSSLNEQIPFCAKKKSKIKDTKNSPLDAQQLRFRAVGANYRSACPTSMNFGFPPEVIFSEFRKKGIKYLIDLRVEASTNSAYKDAVEKFNQTQTRQNQLVYKLFPIEHNNSKFSDPINTNGETQFLTNLSELIGLMNKGGCNVSCGGGLHRTDLFYCLYYIFNPQEIEPPKLSGAFHLQSNINFRIYENILNKIKSHFFNNDKKQSFKFPNINGIRNITGIEFNKRLSDIKRSNNFDI